MQEKKVLPLHELKGYVLRVVGQFSRKLVAECVAIAREQSPNGSSRAGEFLALSHGLNPAQVKIMGQLTRRLAMIRRDHEPDALQKFAREILPLAVPDCIG